MQGRGEIPCSKGGYYPEAFLRSQCGHASVNSMYDHTRCALSMLSRLSFSGGTTETKCKHITTNVLSCHLKSFGENDMKQITNFH